MNRLHLVSCWVATWYTHAKFEFWCKTNWESLFWTAMSWAFQSIQTASSKAACCFPPFWVRLSAPTCRCASAEHMYACCSPWASCSAGTLKQPTISHHYEQVLWAWQWCVIVSMKNAVVVCSGVEIGGLHALSAHVHTRFDCQQRSVSWISGILEVFRAQVRCLEASLKLPSSLHYICSVSLHYIRVAFPDQKEQQISVGSLMGLCY